MKNQAKQRQDSSVPRCLYPSAHHSFTSCSMICITCASNDATRLNMRLFCSIHHVQPTRASQFLGEQSPGVSPPSHLFFPPKQAQGHQGGSFANKAEASQTRCPRLLCWKCIQGWCGPSSRKFDHRRCICQYPAARAGISCAPSFNDRAWASKRSWP